MKPKINADLVTQTMTLVLLLPKPNHVGLFPNNVILRKPHQTMSKNLLWPHTGHEPWFPT